MSHLAIKTRYIGPGNIKGSRVKATSVNKMSVTIGWDNSLDGDENHLKAAKAFCKKYNFVCRLVTGHLEDCFVHVMTKRNYKAEAKLRGTK